MADRVIHYHGLPMTPIPDMVKAMRGRHAMVSFEDPRQIEEAAEVCQFIALDNGAFSAWRSGKTYDFRGMSSGRLFGSSIRPLTGPWCRM